jgi:hypothetical protein
MLSKGELKRIMMCRGWAVGGLMFLVSFLFFAHETMREILTKKAQGTVIEFVKDDHGKIFPIIEYTANGITYKDQMSNFSYKIGDQITILYWDGDPAYGIISGEGYIVGGIFVLLGAIFAAIPYLWWRQPPDQLLKALAGGRPGKRRLRWPW